MTSPRLRLESLEARDCPALVAVTLNSALFIAGRAADSVQITQDAAGSFTVRDGTSTVGTFTGVQALRLTFGRADDHVTLDLGGQTFAGGVIANLGAGANSLTVENGTLTRGVVVNSLAVSSLIDLLFHRPADTGLDTITLAADASVRALAVQGGQGGTAVSVAGSVTANVAVNGLTPGGTAGTSVSITGSVGGLVAFTGSLQADALTLVGDVGRGVTALTLAGDDVIDLAGTITDAVLINAGAGNDTFSLASTAELLRSAVVSLGAGDDAAAVDDAATFAALLLNGNRGTNAFSGTEVRDGLRLVWF